LFQLFHPIGGVGARDADVWANVADPSRLTQVAMRRQARRLKTGRNLRMFIIPRKMGLRNRLRRV
jgi:hypothetical protein